MASKRKVIITVAQTGNFQGKAANPALPEQPSEIVSSAYDCYNAGACDRSHPRPRQGRQFEQRSQHLRRDQHRRPREVPHHHPELHGSRDETEFRGR